MTYGKLANISVYPERVITYASTGEGKDDRADVIATLPILNPSQLHNIVVTNMGSSISDQGHAAVDLSFTHSDVMENAEQLLVGQVLDKFHPRLLAVKAALKSECPRGRGDAAWPKVIVDGQLRRVSTLTFHLPFHVQISPDSIDVQFPAPNCIIVTFRRLCNLGAKTSLQSILKTAATAASASKATASSNV